MSTPQKKTLGTRIMRARKAAGLTQQAVAEKLLINPSTFWAWEHDKSKPSTEMLMRLAKLLQVPVGELNKDAWL